MATTAQGDSIIFDYPAGLSMDRSASAYVQPNVRLEFGALMPVAPWENHEVRPYAASAGSYRMADPAARVRVLAGERTFWEKVTLVHALNSGAADKIGDRKSRHYSDLAMLIDHDIGTRAMERIDLLPIVAAEKESYYPAKAANYPAAARGRLKLAPPDEHLAVIRRDYQAMAEMFHGSDRLTFEEVLARLADLESRVAERLSGADA
ncbi:MAG: nucleotidyl transferase AbiEii/AbiGii toxin family protein [Gemmatimonadales bacterium]